MPEKALSPVKSEEKENGTSSPQNMEESIAKAERAFALRKYEEAVEHYAFALELAVEKFGDDANETADLYFSYGKALLENAISQSAVLGKEQTENNLAKDEANGEAAGSSKPFISFSGDAEEDAEEEEEESAAGAEDKVVDLFAEATAADEAAAKEEEEAQEEEEDGEPEDDFNAAWEVLDLARLNYEKRKDESDAIKLKLAETYIALGDVSLETEKLDLAITDFEAALALKTELLPLSSRQLAEAHYKLSIVLDLTSGRLSQAISHAEKALDSVEARLAEMRNAQSGQMPPKPEMKTDAKGKGKATAPVLAPKELVHNMTKAQIESEIKDLEGLRDELAERVEEMKTTPTADALNAPQLAQKALDIELGVGAAKARDSTVVNDLSTMVKRKKPKTETNGKRKAEEDVLSEAKKVKVGREADS